MPDSVTLRDGRDVLAVNYGGILDGLNSILETLTGMRKQQEDERVARRRLNQQIYPLPAIPVGQLTAATGAGSVLDLPDIMGPKTGNTWFVTRIAAIGFTAGIVNVYYDNANGTPVLPIDESGTATFNATQFPVTQGHRLVFAAGASYSGTTQIEIGVINVADELVGAYLL